MNPADGAAKEFTSNKHHPVTGNYTIQISDENFLFKNVELTPPSGVFSQNYARLTFTLMAYITILMIFKPHAFRTPASQVCNGLDSQKRPSTQCRGPFLHQHLQDLHPSWTQYSRNLEADRHPWNKLARPGSKWWKFCLHSNRPRHHSSQPTLPSMSRLQEECHKLWWPCT